MNYQNSYSTADVNTANKEGRRRGSERREEEQLEMEKVSLDRIITSTEQSQPLLGGDTGRRGRTWENGL